MRKYFEKLFKGSKSDFLKITENNLLENKKMFIVTANPEAFMTAKKDNTLNSLLTDPEVDVVADGIGIVKGANIVGLPVTERIPGIDIANSLLKLGAENRKSVFLFGANAEVIEALCKVLQNDYSGLEIKGAVNGYVDDKDAVFEEIKKLSPDIVLVALGIPTQEKLIYKHYADFTKGIFVGVGGSFDVLSGAKSRAPEFFIKHNLEWLYRITKEPKRLKRFYNSNVKFLLKLNSCKK